MDNVVVWAADDGFTYVSPAFEDIWGVSVEDVLEDDSLLIDGVHPEDRDRVIAERDKLANSQIDKGSVTHRVVQPDGEIRWVEARRFPLHEDGKDKPEVVGVTIDITERVQAQQELTRKNERLKNFGQIISHDLRNPLQSAMGYFGLIRNKYEIKSNYLDGVERALNRIDEIINNVILLAQVGSEGIQEEPVNIENTAKSVWSMTVDSKEASLTVEDDIGTTLADESLFKQLFENLFRNAIEHAGPQVKVSIGTLSGEEGIFIADDGPGIPEGAKEQIFELQYSASEDGTGFGMYIVKSIIDEHGWSIQATNSTESGARFEIATSP